MSLDKRLQLLADEMTPGGYGADIGTDHGYLPVYLIENGTAERMLAADINEGPLESARRTIREHGLSERIDTVLTDGLHGIDLEPVTDILIAGMGGVLMTEILSVRHPLSQKLILQPMTQAPALRTWLMENGYFILKERCAVSAGKPYAMLSARYDGIKREISPMFALIGRTPEDPSPCAEVYLKRQLARLERKYNGLRMSAAGEEISGKETADIKVMMDELKGIISDWKEKNMPDMV